ncbi:MAG: iduronate-sulfatase and sulfatase 1 precursor [Rhodopirellula sp.]|nr:iduronate-sulfatase and sulfatase 1 precursor [Rhodopirellula sp.]
MKPFMANHHARYHPTAILYSFVILVTVINSMTKLQATEAQPDIVFIIVDDLNDWLGCLKGHPDARSPNIDALAASGMLFPQAYCNAPQCRPSRTSLNHGVYPFRTGTYFNAKFKGEKKITTPSLQQFFLNHGYRVASGGKVHHGGPGNRGDSLLPRPRDPKPPAGEDKFGALRPPNDGYALDVNDEQMSDYKVAQWAIEQWEQASEQPLFMSVGFFRPHRPLQVPSIYFDQFPLATIQRPLEPAIDDWADMPDFAKRLAKSHAHKALHSRKTPEGNVQTDLSDHDYIVAIKEWETTIQAYQASIAFVDRQIGRFTKALENNPRNRETIVMLVSDHGWHLGEKKHWCKGAIWEQTTRIPFMVRAPNVKPGSVCMQPVSLVDVFPSLVDLAGLPVPEHLEGKSIKPQLADPTIKRSPVISSYGQGNTAIRSERWRYIRYEDGSEELYDHASDPNEWTNLATSPEHQNIKRELAAAIPDQQHAGLKVQSWFDKYQPQNR